MTPVTQPLRDEHRDLLPEVEVLREAGERIETPAGRDLLERAVRFLTGHLIPHAQAEEAALYPAVGKILGTDRATATMTRDHVEVEAMTRELAGILGGWRGTPQDQQRARLQLFGLYALLRVHFAKEEEVYLPFLDEELSPEEAQTMFAAMEEAAAQAKATGAGAAL